MAAPWRPVRWMAFTLYLRVGWLSDVLAGGALGATWVAVLATVWLVLGRVRGSRAGHAADPSAVAP